MAFHEIRALRFSADFNSVWDRRRRPEQARDTGKRLVRGRRDAYRPDPEKDVDLWA